MCDRMSPLDWTITIYVWIATLVYICQVLMERRRHYTPQAALLYGLLWPIRFIMMCILITDALMYQAKRDALDRAAR